MASSNRIGGFNATSAISGVSCKQMPTILDHIASAKMLAENARKSKTRSM